MMKWCFAPLVVVLSWCFAAVLRSQPPAEEAPFPRGLQEGLFPAARFKLQGASSCAAMACHNNAAMPGAPGGEYATWIENDKHARAYLVLFSNRSRQIEKNLYGLKSIALARPEGNVLCLKCHVHPQADREAVVDAGKIFPDGVSCEACHGPAEKWLSLHFHNSWKHKTSAAKDAWGMYDTRSILGRARLCVDCHVGTPAADVNHDLLAAGHPRLRFEFGAYHANMPRHWSDARDKDPDADPRGRPDFEARVWFVGQAVTAQAALNLLAARADRKNGPWPEFAEYDCFSCHHDLQDSRSRHQRTRLPGALSWESWYTLMTPRALAGSDERDSKRLEKSLASLRLEMEKTGSNRARIARQAGEAADLLKSAAHKLDRTVRVEELFWTIVREDGGKGTQTWDNAGQIFNALAALHNAWSDMTPESPRRIAARRQLLLFGRKLPAGPEYDTPGGNLDSIRAPLKQLQKLAPR
jgi:hypothetical protein